MQLPAGAIKPARGRAYDMRTNETAHDIGSGRSPLAASGITDRLLRALRKLSGRTMALVAEGEVVLVSDRQGHPVSCSGGIDAATWELMEIRGFVVREKDGRWRLSNAGRIHLKRLMSRGGGTREAHAKAGPEQASTGVRLATDRSNMAESPLSWLRQRKDKNGRPLISQVQFEAGERLRSDFERGSMMARVTVNWSGTGGTSPGTAPDRELELRSDALEARERVRSALAEVGPELSGILIDVCCHLKGLSDVERQAGWPQRTAKVILLLALSTLARHYGLSDGDAEARASRVQHWGADDYRPSVNS